MDEIGFENFEKIKKISNESDRWRFIYNIAKNYGFEGIHLTNTLYKELNLDLNNIPSYFNEFKLTYHFGGLYKINSIEELQSFDNDLKESFDVAINHNMHDISIHPPYTYGLSLAEKKLCLYFFNEAINKWVKIALQHNISFSLETHVTGEFFLFNGLNQYVQFIDNHSNLGILIDISHNYFDGYSEEDIY
ncbi:MAG: sugar phosphate isomerase/epimerase [Oscillospiraceae bacterium]|nr:sugar phosphate isomerase/epimerase [Oscillospiraceae bacterium]